MSHQATTWAIQQRGLPPAAKLVLWHLADRFHPDHGCFPKQAVLAHDCEMSRASLNTQLALLEERGLIRREKRQDPATRKQLSTRYRFPFESEFPCPDIGHGSVDKPCDAAEARVQNSGDPVSSCLDTEPVREPLNKNPPQSPPFAADEAERDDALDEGGGDREPDDEVTRHVADAGDEGREEELAAARSLAARKAADTRLLHQLIHDWPGGVAERRPAIDAAWAAMSAQDKRDAVERVPVYLRRVKADKRKPGKIARYLSDGSWRALPASPKRVERDTGAPLRPLPWSAVEGFLAHGSARDVLELAARDGVTSLLAGAVREAHRVPNLTEYAARCDGWRAMVRSWRERVSGSQSVAPAVRVAAGRSLEFREKWQAFAADVLAGGEHARDGPGGRGHVSGEAAE